jgi:hypothetical protein
VLEKEAEEDRREQEEKVLQILFVGKLQTSSKEIFAQL